MFRKFFGLIIALGLLGGCNYVNPIGPIIDIGVYWYNGEAHKYYNTETEVFRKSVYDVLEELKLPIIEEKVYPDYRYIVAGDQKTKFGIKIRSVREGITKLSIRVNTFGDHPYAELIFRHVDKRPGVKEFATSVELNTAMERRRRR